jgi:hypothetical protein
MGLHGARKSLVVITKGSFARALDTSLIHPGNHIEHVTQALLRSNLTGLGTPAVAADRYPCTVPEAVRRIFATDVRGRHLSALSPAP